jgi:hypothetical protein
MWRGYCDWGLQVGTAFVGTRLRRVQNRIRRKRISTKYHFFSPESLYP